jgi:magnesium transporter
MRIPSISYKNTKWTSIKSPTREHIEWLGQNFPFHPLDLEESLSRVQRPRLDNYTNYVSLVFQFPHVEESRLIASELNVFVGEDYLVTLHNERLDIVDNLFKKCRKSKRETTYYLKLGPARLLYTLVDKLVDSCFPLLERVGKDIEEIDKQIFKMAAKDIVEKISLIRRNVIIFQTMIKPQIAIVSELEKGEGKLLNGNLKNYWGNISDHLHKIWDRLEDYHELIEGLSATNESLLSHRTNEIMKVLTVFSVVLLPLTLLAGIYGMNLAYLPLARHPTALPIIGVFMLSLVIFMLSYFKKKRWI